MNHYTQLPKNDIQIQSYLDTVADHIKSKVPQTTSIMLAGGFGRGEGSAIVKKGQVIPLNDFDIYLTTTKKISENFLNQVANQAAKKLNLPVRTGTNFFKFSRSLHSHTFYVDLKAMTLSELTKLPPMIRYLELKQASHLIWGQDFRPKMPKLQVNQLPLSEGFRLLLNRLALLNLYFSPNFSKRKLTTGETHALHYLASKIILDIPTALLLLNQRFVPSYQKRAQIFSRTYHKDFTSLADKFPQLPQVVNEFTQWKMRPKFTSIKNPLKLWLHYRDLGGAATLYYAQRIFGHQVKNYSDLADRVYRQLWKNYYPPYVNNFIRHKTGIKTKAIWPSYPLMRLLNLIYFLRLLQIKKAYPRVILNPKGPDVTMLSAMINLLYSVNSRGKINQTMLRQAESTLEKTFPLPKLSKNPEQRWQKLNQAFSQSYVLFFFQKII